MYSFNIFTPLATVNLQWNWRDSQSLQLSRNLINILADICCGMNSQFFLRFLVPPFSISQSLGLFHGLQLWLVSITFMFHNFFSFLVRSRYLSTQWSAEMMITIIEIQTDNLISARWPDLVIVNNNKKREPVE